MIGEEQVYPIEKSTDVENVLGLSAFQIDLLLRVADAEALYGAATDYLGAAESLEALAEEIRRGATDLAETWRGAAASRSQHQLRRYYASARSLATACRASAAAMHHAATSLERAQVRARYLHAQFHPFVASRDPASIESGSYQQLLRALNSSYRAATAMAPTQVAVSLPSSSRGEGGHDSEWDSIADGAPVRRDGRSDGADGEPVGRSDGADGEPFRPSRLSPLIPPTGKDPGTRSRNGGDRRAGLRPAIVPSLTRTQSYADGSRDDVNDRWSGAPYIAGSSLAGGGGLGGLGDRLDGPDFRGSAPGDLGRQNAGADGPGGKPATRLTGVGGNQGIGPGSGILPPGNGQREDERERERRYYLTEDREIWGSPEASPAILYGAHPPPQRYIDDDDDF